jgi:hypothetical protein
MTGHADVGCGSFASFPQCNYEVGSNPNSGHRRQGPLIGMDLILKPDATVHFGVSGLLANISIWSKSSPSLLLRSRSLRYESPDHCLSLPKRTSDRFLSFQAQRDHLSHCRNMRRDSQWRRMAVWLPTRHYPRTFGVGHKFCLWSSRAGTARAPPDISPLSGCFPIQSSGPFRTGPEPATTI